MNPRNPQHPVGYQPTKQNGEYTHVIPTRQTVNTPGIFTPVTWNANDFNAMCERIARTSEPVAGIYRYSKSDHARLLRVNGIEIPPVSHMLMGAVLRPNDYAKGPAHGGGLTPYEAFTAWVHRTGSMIMNHLVYIDGRGGTVRVALIPIPSDLPDRSEYGIG